MHDLSYQEFFSKKRVSHEDALKERIRSLLTNIIREEKGISEKSFKLYDEVINRVKSDFSDKMFAEANILYNQNKRLDYIAELLYDKYFKEDLTKENKLLKINEITASDDGVFAIGATFDTIGIPISTDDKKPTTTDLVLTADKSKNTDGTTIDRKKSVVKNKSKVMNFNEFQSRKKQK